MLNEILWFGLLFFCLSAVIIIYRLFGRTGLYIWTGVAIILANIQVLMTVEIFGMVTALGNVTYSSIFLITDILNENHTKKDAQKAVWVGFFVLIAAMVIMQITILFVPYESDIISEHIKEIFNGENYSNIFITK